MAADAMSLWEAYDEDELPCDCPLCYPYDDDDDYGTCPDCGAAADEECEADCPSWDEEDQ